MQLQAQETTRNLKYLSGDTTAMGRGMNRLQKLYDELQTSYDKLLENNAKLLSSSSSENKTIMSELQSTQTELQNKEDRLNELQIDLESREKRLADLTNELELREGKVRDLNRILNAKDSSMQALKNQVSSALLDFENSGLTVSQANGQVMVSLEEKLLFASGSTVVDSKGKEAISKLAEVLEKNKDISIVIEGHTDNVPMKSANIKDNWDLSVMRATSVVRILMSSADIDPARLLPSGRGEHQPLVENADSESKRKNRRIEIILSPNLDKLYELVE
ncbi:MAG: OmpA family protein [Bacteroidia bacterium]|nr:OmpA family protein [Bacteroidia bacterium]